MKQAVLITAYRSFDHLIELISFFDDDFYIYIHIDKKNRPQKTLINTIRSLKNVVFISSKYKIYWGGLNHLKCYLLLSEEALKKPDIVYFHLISGQDFPIKSLSHFKNIIKEDNLKDYMEFFKLPTPVWKNQNGGLDRIEYYNLFDVINAKKYIKWLWLLVRIQKRIRFSRPVSTSIGELYGGFTWWSLTRNTLQFVIDYTKEKPYFINRMKHTFCPEEMYFQTVIMNSEYAKNVVNDNLRYIDWNPDRTGKYETSPAVLDITDFEKVKNSNKLFARKFDSPISDKLKEALQNTHNK